MRNDLTPEEQQELDLFVIGVYPKQYNPVQYALEFKKWQRANFKKALKKLPGLKRVNYHKKE